MPSTKARRCTALHCIECYADPTRDDCCTCGHPLDARPARPRRSFLPFEPWRLVLLATILLVAGPVGLEAARPVFNGADVMALILLALFAGLFFIRPKGPNR